jgi:transposase
MKKNLPPKLNSEILKQLATEKLVEMILEQARVIEQYRLLKGALGVKSDEK